jgi:hypothetical protein
MMDAIRFSDTSVLIRATRRNIPEDCILQEELHYLLKICLRIGYSLR